VEDAHAHDIAVAVYGINTLAHLAGVRRRGVDVVVTDFPERIVRAVRQH